MKHWCTRVFMVTFASCFPHRCGIVYCTLPLPVHSLMCRSGERVVTVGCRKLFVCLPACIPCLYRSVPRTFADVVYVGAYGFIAMATLHPCGMLSYCTSIRAYMFVSSHTRPLSTNLVKSSHGDPWIRLHATFQLCVCFCYSGSCWLYCLARLRTCLWILSSSLTSY